MAGRAISINIDIVISATQPLYAANRLRLTFREMSLAVYCCILSPIQANATRTAFQLPYNPNFLYSLRQNLKCQRYWYWNRLVMYGIIVVDWIWLIKQKIFSALAGRKRWNGTNWMWKIQISSTQEWATQFLLLFQLVSLPHTELIKVKPSCLALFVRWANWMFCFTHEKAV